MPKALLSTARLHQKKSGSAPKRRKNDGKKKKHKKKHHQKKHKKVRGSVLSVRDFLLLGPRVRWRVQPVLAAARSYEPDAATHAKSWALQKHKRSPSSSSSSDDSGQAPGLGGGRPLSKVEQMKLVRGTPTTWTVLQ